MLNYFIIIGGGYSINTGLNMGLKEKLENKNVITLNYSFLHFPHAFMVFVDKGFYIGDSKHPNISDNLKKEPLIVGFDNNTNLQVFGNTILLKGSNKFYKNPKNGFYNPILCGLYALHIACWLLDYKGEIYLLGYDFNFKKYNITHYYTDIIHRGVGFVSFYNSKDPNILFSPFTECGCKIFNIIGDPESRIGIFENITYEGFIKVVLDSLPSVDYNEVRNIVKNKLKTLIF